jgi:hypothetical protein
MLDPHTRLVKTHQTNLPRGQSHNTTNQSVFIDINSINEQTVHRLTAKVGQQIAR